MGPKLPSSCGRPIIYGILCNFSSKASLFTGFWLGWVGKARFFFTRQMPSHSGGPYIAAELRSRNSLRQFWIFLLQSLVVHSFKHLVCHLYASFGLAWSHVLLKPAFSQKCSLISLRTSIVVSTLNIISAARDQSYNLSLSLDLYPTM